MTASTTPVPGSVLDGEALYEQAKVFATRDKPSTSYLQRRLQIGFNAASRLIERMEDEGLVSRPNSAGKRSILRPHREVSGEGQGSSAGADTHRTDGQVSGWREAIPAKWVEVARYATEGGLTAYDANTRLAEFQRIITPQAVMAFVAEVEK